MEGTDLVNVPADNRVRVMGLEGIVYPDGSGSVHLVDRGGNQGMGFGSGPIWRWICNQVVRPVEQRGEHEELRLLLMAPDMLVRLFLEGRVNRAQLEHAAVSDGALIVTGVRFEGDEGKYSLDLDVESMPPGSCYAQLGE